MEYRWNIGKITSYEWYKTKLYLTINTCYTMK